MRVRNYLSLLVAVVVTAVGLSAFAQPKANLAKAAAATQYATVGMKDKVVVYNGYGENGANLLSEVDVQTALIQLPKDGWKLHSVVSVVRGGTYEIHKDGPTPATPHTMYSVPTTYYMIIAEK
ncbi:MAG: hypothetical protein JSS72_10730 [Armatimonadetes bacterium]|nr:hypothetical protein [Armatimonadota bacterium]